VQEVSPGPPEQVRRLERYRQEHPDVGIQPPGAESAVWRAFRDGNLIAYGFTLMVFLERLEALPELLGVAQDFGVHLRPGIPLALLPGVPRGRGTAGPGMLNRRAARTPGAPRHERTARGSVQLRRDRYQRRHARAVHGGNDRRDDATGLPPPRGNPVQAGDAGGWY
jgi:hypothetical protein